MPPELLQLLEPARQAIAARAWYPFASIILTLLISLYKRIRPEVWNRLPQRWQWAPAAGIAGAGAFVDGAAHALGPLSAAAVGVYALVAGALPAIGAHHTGKRMRS